MNIMIGALVRWDGMRQTNIETTDVILYGWEGVLDHELSITHTTFIHGTESL